MSIDDIKTFDDLARYVMLELFDALIVGGTREMKSRFYLVYNVICQWQEKQEDRSR